MALLQFVNNVGEDLEQGDVVVIAPRQPETPGQMGLPSIEVELAGAPYDSSVCGVVFDLYVEHKPDDGQATDSAESEENRQSDPKATSAPSGPFAADELERLDRSKIAPGQMGQLAVSGVCAVCKVDADIAPIEPGDLLTTSATKGHAQKVVDLSKAAGSVLGKALGSLKEGKGAIPVLVTLQ